MEAHIASCGIGHETAETLGATPGLALEWFQDPDPLLDALAGGAHTRDVVVLGERVEDPIALAQRVHQLTPEAEVLLWCPADRVEPLRSAVRFSPFLGGQVTCVAAATAGTLVRAVQEAASRVQRKRQNRAWLAAAQRSIESAPEPRLQASAVLGHFLDQAPIGVLLFGPRSALVTGNRRAWELLEERPEAGRPLEAVFARYEASWVASLVDRVRAGEAVAPELLHTTIATASARHVEITVSRMPSEQGEFVTMILLQDVTARVPAALGRAIEQLERANRDLAREVTERRNAEQALRAHAADLERSNRELNEFAHIASHDLKEPLRGMSIAASILREEYADRLDASGRAKLETLPQQAERLSTRIDALREYALIGRTPPRIEPVELETLLGEVLGALATEVAAHHVSVRRPRPLPTVSCDRAEARQVLQALIANAVKYHDGSEPWVEIDWQGGREREDGTRQPVVLVVRDNGIGVRPEHHEAIFRLFKRLHGRDEFGGGLGVALAFAKKIVERHGGRIWIESVPDEGTAVHFTLERADVEPARGGTSAGP